MIGLRLKQSVSEPLQILCLGSHSDDIEIGCGGSILRLAEEFPDCTFHWVVFSAVGVRATEAERGANLFVAPARLNGPHLKNFRDGFMSFMGDEVKGAFEDLKVLSRPI